MGANSTNNSKILFSLIYDIYKEINSFNEESDLGIDKIIDTIELFFLSDKFIPFAVYELTEKTTSFKNNIIIILEQKQKYLSLKILPKLLERLNSEKFILQVKKLLQIRQNKQEEEVLNLYFNQNTDKIEKSHDVVIGGRFEGFNHKYIEILGIIYHNFFYFKFKEFLSTQENNKNFVRLEIFNKYFMKFEEYFKSSSDDWIKKETDTLINYLTYLNSNGTKEILQLFLLFLNAINNKKKIKEIANKVDISHFIFGINYGNYITMNFMNIGEKLIWAIYDSNISIFEGKKTDDEKFSLDIFIKGSGDLVFRSIFTNREIIIMDIRFFALFIKNEKLTIEQFKQEKDKIIDQIKKKKEIILYINIKNKIINTKYSFDSLVNELIILKIFEGQKAKEEIISLFLQDNKNEKDDKNEINDNNKIFDSKEIDDLKMELKKEKDNSQKLIEKINKLENELNLEKMKNKEFEKELINLKNKLNDKINLELNQKEKEKEKPINIEFKNESKELFLETIMEKDKEIKELKLKLSRYPFELMEGEKIISIILTSVDQKFFHSIICKNKEKFNIIENKFYEAYPDYIETENFFTLNGKKVNKYKTLDDNNIKNNDIILLNIIN